MLFSRSRRGHSSKFREQLRFPDARVVRNYSKSLSGTIRGAIDGSVVEGKLVKCPAVYPLAGVLLTIGESSGATREGRGSTIGVVEHDLSKSKA